MFGRISAGLVKAGTGAVGTRAKCAHGARPFRGFSGTGGRVLGPLSGARVGGGPAARFSVSSGTLGQAPAGGGGVVKSPYPDLAIDEEISLPHFIVNQMDEFGEGTALVDGVTGRRVSYRQLKADIIKVASGLRRLGLARRQTVTIYAPNSIEWCIFYLAAGLVGCVVSSVNPLYTVGELAHALSHSDSKYIVTIPELAPVCKAAHKHCPNIKSIIVFGESDGCVPFSSLLADDGKEFPETADIHAMEDIMALPYSSGTTGLPKGVMLSHSNLVANIQQLRAPHLMQYGGQDTLLGVLPFFHIYGQVVVLLSGLKGGATIVIMPKFDPELFLNCASSYKATYLHVVPPIALFLAKHPVVSKYDLSFAETMFVGAAPIGVATMNAVIQRFGGKMVVRQGYGLTEASPVTHGNPHARDKIKLNTIGPAVPNTEFRVIDTESGVALPIGEEGELCVRGPQVMKGYLKNPIETGNTIKDGWLRTGDTGYYDKDGYVIISDRLKELIKVKGFQVAPAELEALLVGHEAVLDAAVIGKPDEKSGELPLAYIVLKAGKAATVEDIQNYVKGKVAPFKELAGGVHFIKEIPKSATGKILRRILKEDLKKE